MAAEVVINFIGDAKSFTKAAGVVEGGLGTLGKAAIATGPLVGAAAVGVGVGLFKVGESFDKASDTIRIGTGATGEALGALEQSFKNVISNVPADFGDASTAIADLNTRLGITGKPLEQLSEQMLNLSRITGTDVAGNVDRMTRVFGDWGVSTEDQSKVMDELFRMSQNTGIGIDDLATKVVDFGSPLRNMGVTLEESAALFGKFQKEGVNTETVMAGMKMALGNFAQAGRDPEQALAETIAKIKEFNTAGEAMPFAIDAFGKRAAPDMVAAIREGKFELADLVDGMENGSDTINGAAKDTEDFAEKWKVFKNRILVGLEPIATKVFDGMGKLMDKLGPKLGPFIEMMQRELPPAMAKIQTKFQEIWVVAKPILDRLIVAVQGFVDTIVKNWPQIMTVVGQVQDVFRNVALTVQTLWEKFGDRIVSVLMIAVKLAIKLLQGAFDIIRGIIEVFTGIITGDWSKVWDGIKLIFSGAWTAITAILSAAIGVFGEILKTLWTIIKAVFKELGGIAWNALQAGWSAVTGGISSLVTAIKNKGADFFNAAKELGGKIIDGIKSGITGAANIASNFANAVKDKVKSVINSGVIDKVNRGLEFKISAFGQSINIDPPDIPRLAKGGLVSSPTLAMVGDTIGDSEIVAPTKMMREIVRQESGAGINIGTINMNTNAKPDDLAKELGWLMMTRGR